MNKNSPQNQSSPSDASDQTFSIDTPSGVIEVPVDEHWQDYTHEERESVRKIVLFLISNEEVARETRKEIAEFGLTIRDFSGPMDFESSKKAKNGTLIMEGDWGGQIYLICPMKYIQCSEDDLNRLLEKIDQLCWSCNENDGASLNFKRKNPGDGVIGGMGGGTVVDGLWVHPEIDKKKLIDRIWDILQGRATTLNI